MKKTVNRKKIIRRIENIISFISIIDIIFCLGSIIAMVENGMVITGSVVFIILSMIWFGIIAVYHYIVNILYNR